jgi:hypothetical protein
MKLKFPPLGTRLLTALGAKGAAAEAHSDRLRDVLGRDRALVVGARTQARAAPVGASTEPRRAILSDVPGPAPATAAAPDAVVQAPGTPEPAASAGSDERPQRVQHEPIRTRTMARLLAAQGYRQRALAIYEELLAAPLADDSLRSEAEALRLRSV